MYKNPTKEIDSIDNTQPTQVINASLFTTLLTAWARDLIVIADQRP
jgi:hypothetical protein